MHDNCRQWICRETLGRRNQGNLPFHRPSSLCDPYFQANCFCVTQVPTKSVFSFSIPSCLEGRLVGWGVEIEKYCHYVSKEGECRKRRFANSTISTPLGTINVSWTFLPQTFRPLFGVYDLQCSWSTCLMVHRSHSNRDNISSSPNVHNFDSFSLRFSSNQSSLIIHRSLQTKRKGKALKWLKPANRIHNDNRNPP
jgi:hypothetical protein